MWQMQSLETCNGGEKKLWCHGEEGALFVVRSQGERERAGEEAVRRAGSRHHVCPWSHWERTNVYLPRVHLEEGIASPRAPLSGHSAGDRGAG